MKKYLRKNQVWFAGACALVFASNGFAVVLQFFKGDVLDWALAQNLGETVKYAGLLAGFILCEVLCYFLHAVCKAEFVAGCAGLLKRDIFSAILGRSYVAYRQKQTGEYLAKYTGEADAIQNRYFGMLPLLGEILSKVVFVGIALFLLDVRIAVVTIVLLTTPLYVPKLIEKRLQRAQGEYLEAVRGNLAKVNDWLAGFEIVKNFSIEEKILEKFADSNREVIAKMGRDARLGAVSQLLTTLISYLSYFIVLACAAWLVLDGRFSAGDFFVAVGMIDQLSYPLIALAGIIRQLLSIRPACVLMERFLQEGGEAAGMDVLSGFAHAIRFDGVGFSYDGRRQVLQDFNFTMEKGKCYLLKGPSGCGKTTAVNLLLRYYDPDKGTVTVDGVPVGRYGSTYGCVTVVRQEAVLFCDTLRNNLTMYQDVEDARLMELLKSVGLERYAKREALDTVVAEGGANFSGGEKKRICLARALLRKTDVLVLDEPLANLDRETADRIEDLILAVSDRTVLVVSHQFSKEKTGAFDRVVNL